MSTNSILICCNGNDYSHMENFLPITIKCKIGNIVATYDHTTAWCNQCGKICYIEYLPTLEELQFEYDRRVRPTPESALPKSNDSVRLFGSSKPLLRGRWYEGNIKELKKRIIWRRQRVAPPHCLTCGTTDVTLVDYEQVNDSMLISKTFRHVCGGALVIDYNNDPDIRFSFGNKVIWMDIEGNLLENSEDESNDESSIDLPDFLK